jgi:hypothetical protein
MRDADQNALAAAVAPEKFGFKLQVPVAAA